jgi:hypothetical protein
VKDPTAGITREILIEDEPLIILANTMLVSVTLE